MSETLPATIDNGHGEVITFKAIMPEPDGDRLLLEGRLQPGAGPAMHVHRKQDEHFHVVQGTMAYLTPGAEPRLLRPGESATFQRNQPHKFWNAGEDELVIDCWIKPANNAVFYLSTLYEATRDRTEQEPDPFTGAFLIRRYGSEYGILEIPAFVRAVVVPLTYAIGTLLGRYRRFRSAPDPV